VELNENQQRLRKRGLGIAAISYDSVAILKNFAERKRISIALLADSDSAVIRRFGVLNESIPATSPFFGIPNPVTFIVDRNGVIRSRHFEEDFRRRPTIGSILGEPVTASATVQNPRLAVEASASDSKIRGGERIRLFVQVNLAPHMHVYAPGVTGYIPLEWKMTSPQPLEAGPVTWPASRILYLKAIDERVPVFERTFRISRDVVIGASRDVEQVLTPDRKLRIEGSLRVQACDDKMCYLPEEIPLVWTLAYEPHDSTRVPPELRKMK
jgi:hypothetical protein